MRMWLVPVSLLCQKHLLGEHLEMHMFVGAIKKGTRMDGYIRNGLLEPDLLVKRHDDLALEMTKRGVKHKTPMQRITRMPPGLKGAGKVDVALSERVLRHRCKACNELWTKLADPLKA